MRVDIVLCGSMFGLQLIRHRWFECSFPIFALTMCQHHPNPVVACGRGTHELSQAVPPDYSEFLARQFLRLTAPPRRG